MKQSEILVVDDGRKGMFELGIGYLFMGLGLLLMIAPHTSGEPIEDIPSALFLLAFGGLFCWGGSLLALRWTTMSIDLHKSCLISSTKYLWFPKREQETPLSKFTKVMVADKKRRLKRRTISYRSVYLFSPTPLVGIHEAAANTFGTTQVGVELFRYKTDEEAVPKAEEVASLLSLPMEVNESLPDAKADTTGR
jgi:hypothetical protein